MPRKYNINVRLFLNLRTKQINVNLKNFDENIELQSVEMLPRRCGK